MGCSCLALDEARCGSIYTQIDTGQNTLRAEVSGKRKGKRRTSKVEMPATGRAALYAITAMAKRI